MAASAQCKGVRATTGRRSLLLLAILSLLSAMPLAVGYSLDDFLAALNDYDVLYHEVKGDVVLKASLPDMTGRNFTLVGKAPGGKRPVIDGGSKYGGSSTFSLTVKNLEFRNFNGTGAIFQALGHDIVIQDCAFFNNRVIGGLPGSVVSVHGASLKISDSLFVNNSVEGRSDNGGAVSCFASDTVIDRTVFRNNQVMRSGGAGQGGAVSILFAMYRIRDCVFEGNKVDGKGGAIAATLSSTGEITGSSFSGNSAYSTRSGWRRYATGGAIEIYGENVTVISGCTFRGNKAEGTRGGAVSLSMYHAEATISVCKFEKNSARMYGGAVGMRLVPTELTEGAHSNYVSDLGPPRSKLKFCRGNTYFGNVAGKSGAKNIFVDMRNSSGSVVFFCPTRPSLALIEANPGAETISCASC